VTASGETRGGRQDHKLMIRRLKGVSIAGAAIAAAGFWALVGSHHVGGAATSAQPIDGAGTPTTDAVQAQAAGPVDPFFDPNPGSVNAGTVQPIFGGGGNGAGPALRATGS
jgi:hypothetical protein